MFISGITPVIYDKYGIKGNEIKNTKNDIIAINIIVYDNNNDLATNVSNTEELWSNTVKNDCLNEFIANTHASETTETITDADKEEILESNNLLWKKTLHEQVF